MRWIQRLLDRNTRLQEYRGLSGSWETCAVGEAHQDFPNVVLLELGDVPSAPIDPELYKLGTRFDEQVARGHRNLALKTYDAIQRRVRVLASR